MKRKRSIIFILTVAFVIRLIMVLYSPGEPHEDFASYYRHAIRLVNGLGFSTTGGPTAFRGPAYPYMLAMVFRVTGVSLLAAKFVNILLGTLTVLAAYLLAREVFSKTIGLITAAIVTLAPSLILYTPIIASENLATPFLLFSLWLFLCGFNAQQSWRIFLGGICLAVVCLTRPGFLLLPAVLVIYIVVRRIRPSQAVRFGLLFLVGLFISILPWTVRNFYEFREFIPISTNGGFNLAIGFCEAANGTYIGNITELILGKEFDWEMYKLIDSSLTEYEVDKQLRQAAIDYAVSHPGRVILLGFQKLRYFYQDDVSGVYHNIASPSRQTPAWFWTGFRWLAQLYYLAMMAAAFSSLVFYRQLQKYKDALLIGLVIFYWSSIHLIFFGADRFHLPILPLIFMFSSFSIYCIYKRRFG